MQTALPISVKNR